ncbi:hypothetical protein L9F63_006764, partial [Diploptera punctata]
KLFTRKMIKRKRNSCPLKIQPQWSTSRVVGNGKYGIAYWDDVRIDELLSEIEKDSDGNLDPPMVVVLLLLLMVSESTYCVIYTLRLSSCQHIIF